MKEFKEVDNGIDIAGEDLSDIFLHKNIGNFDIESIYSKIDSSNLIDTYNAYINEEIDKIVDLSGKDEILFVKNMKEHYGSEETKKLFSKVGYDDITDPIKVKFYFLARIDLYNNLISKYIDILKYNYSQLSIEEINSDLANKTESEKNENQDIATQKKQNNRKVVKIMVFYSDNTFETFSSDFFDK